MPSAAKPYRNRIELLQGTLDMLTLQTLQWGAQHGYAISQAIRTQSGDVLKVETVSLYPALHRIERQGWITSEWRQTEQNQLAKFYRVTTAGRRQLARDRSKWETIVAAIGGSLSLADESRSF
jgi:transcriptional regulator